MPEKRKYISKSAKLQIKETNEFLAKASHEDLAVANRSPWNVSPANIKFDGATEMTGNANHTANIIKTRIASCREAYENAGIIGNAIDLMVDFALEGFDIVHEDPAIQTFYQSWATKIDLGSICMQILKCYFRDGNVPIYTSRGRIKAKEINTLKKAVSAKTLFINDKNPAKVIPYKYQILDIMNLDRYGSETLGDVRYQYKISLDDYALIRSPKTEQDQASVKSLENNISEEDFNTMKEGGYINIAADRLIILYYKKDDYRAWANPMFWRIISDIQYKKLMRDMDISICESVINTLTIVSLGATKEGLPPDENVLKRFASLLKTPSKSQTIVWNDLIDIKSSYPPVDTILGKEKYEQVDADIRAGLGIAEVVLNGQGNNYSNSFLSVKTLLERLEGGRQVLLEWLTEETNKVAKAMGFKKPAWFKMHHMSLRDEDAEKKLLLELVDRNMLSYQTCVDRFGENFEIEVARMRQEDNLRRKEERKYPFLITKVGKFGPMMNQGPMPTIEILDSSTTEDLKNKPVSKKQSPFIQEEKGKLGGRPILTKKTQKKKETPRTKPKGQKVTSYIKFDNVYSIIERSFVQGRKVGKFEDLDNKDKQNIYNSVAIVLGSDYCQDHMTTQDIKNVLNNDKNKNKLFNLFSVSIESYKKSKGEYPSFQQQRKIIESLIE